MLSCVIKLQLLGSIKIANLQWCKHQNVLVGESFCNFILQETRIRWINNVPWQLHILHEEKQNPFALKICLNEHLSRNYEDAK